MSFVLSQLSPLLSWCRKYRDMLQRIAVTVAMLTIMRSGMFIPLPGVDLVHLQDASVGTEGEVTIRPGFESA